MRHLVVVAVLVFATAMFIRADGTSFEDGIYQDLETGFRVSFPEGWKDERIPVATFAVVSPDEESSCVLQVQEVPRDAAVDDLIELARRQGGSVQLQRRRTEDVLVGGIRGIRGETLMKVGGDHFRTADLHFVRTGTGVSLQCLAPERRYPDFASDFDATISSFAWLH